MHASDIPACAGSPLLILTDAVSGACRIVVNHGWGVAPGHSLRIVVRVRDMWRCVADICVTHGHLKLLHDYNENDDGTRTYEPYCRLLAGSMLGACAVHLYLTPSDAAKAADVLHLTVEDMT